MDVNQQFRRQLGHTLDLLEDMLVQKREKYGPLDALNVFSNLGVEDGLRIRMDDKLRRLKQTQEDDEDTFLDFIGYALLLYIETYVQGHTISDTDSRSGTFM